MSSLTAEARRKYGLPATVAEYGLLMKKISTLPDQQKALVMRKMGAKDLFFLLRYILSTREWMHPEKKKESLWDRQWFIDRARELQFDSHEVLNIWARYHGKSTMLTFAMSIFILIQDPNETIGIFSVTKSVADDFVRQIKEELERNALLKALYPDKFWADPKKESSQWTVKDGFTCKQTITSIKDASVKGYGLLDSNFTGKRLSTMIWDDAVNEQNVTTPEQIEKTNRAWELSLNVGFPGTKRFAIGTFYAAGDTYHLMAHRGFRLRLHPCYQVNWTDSKFDPESGLPIKLVYNNKKSMIYSTAHLNKEETRMGPVTFAIQLLCNPNASSAKGFKYDWFQTYDKPAMQVAKTCNAIVVVDPAADKKKYSSYTSMWVIGLGDDGCYHVLDGLYDKVNLAEKTNALFSFVQHWNALEVRYEKYSFQADIEHIRHVMNERSFFFNIVEVGGSLSKDDRIGRLSPLFKAGKILFPRSLPYTTVEGDEINLTQVFRDREYLQWPNSQQKDGLDSLSRVCEKDLPLPWPKRRAAQRRGSQWRDMLYAKPKREGTWMTAGI